MWAAALAMGLAATPAASALPQADCSAHIAPESSSASFIVGVRLPIRAEGRFNQIEGQLSLRPEGCEVEVRLDATAVVYTGPNWFADLSRSPAFLDVETHPEVNFVSQPFPASRLVEGGVLLGTLRLRGHERPVEFQLQPSGCDSPGQACPILVRGSVNRRDFGMQAYRFTVRDAVHFEFSIRLEPAQ